MPGKRKRDELNLAAAPNPDSNGKPISAIAAARLKAAAATQAPITDGLDNVPQSPFVDGSESDFAESDLEEFTQTADRNFDLCTWRRSEENILSDTDHELTIILEKNVTVAFVGCYEVKVLKGAININGANIGAVTRGEERMRAHRVFVSSTQPITKVRGLDRTNRVQFLHCEEPAPLAKISPLFVDIWASASGCEKERSFRLVTQSAADPLSRPLIPEYHPESWLRAIEDIASAPSIVLITGPSSSGKSTFAKRLLNRYLTGLGRTAKAVPAVCYLDLDPSKPEYTPHGQVSLVTVRELNLRPSFMYPTDASRTKGVNQTLAAQPLPVNNLADYERYFISCVSELFQTYQNQPKGSSTQPLVINTPAALYTTHFSLLESMLGILKPRHIIHLGDITAIEPDTALKLDSLQVRTKGYNATLHELEAQLPPLPPSRTDPEQRAMQMQSHFHFDSCGLSEMGWDTRPLTHVAPWEFCFRGTATRSQDLIGILPLFEPLPPDQILTALNGTIIHIVETFCPTTKALYQNLPRTPDQNIPYFEPSSTGMTEPLNPQTSRLVCTALIRGFDLESKTLQVVVPKSHESLLHSLMPETTVFVAGCCDTPEWAYTEDAYAQVNKQVGNMQVGKRFVGGDVVMEGVDLPPWAEKKSVVEDMGYLNTVRRVRKFLG